MPGDQDSNADGSWVPARYLLGEETLAETLTRVVDVAKQALPADMVGITMVVDGRPATAVFTDSEAPEIDAHQYHGDFGPCVHAFRTNQMVTIPCVADDTRWPEFTTTAERFGIKSTLSLPLSVPEGALGALNLYSHAEGAFDVEHRQLGATFAVQAAVLLSNARVYADARELNQNLRQALESRAFIDYAIGILIAQSAQSPEDAFQLLVRASQRENRKLREIAIEIVERARDRSSQHPPETVPTT